MRPQDLVGEWETSGLARAKIIEPSTRYDTYFHKMSTVYATDWGWPAVFRNVCPHCKYLQERFSVHLNITWSLLYQLETAPQPFSPVKKMARSNTPTIAAASLWLLHDRGSLIPNLLTHGGLAELLTALDQQTVASDQTTHRSHESL